MVHVVHEVPGIKCDDGHDFTELFLEDGSRNAGNRRTTPLEVEHPKDVAAFHARSTNCPWAKPNLRRPWRRRPIPWRSTRCSTISRPRNPSR